MRPGYTPCSPALLINYYITMQPYDYIASYVRRRNVEWGSEQEICLDLFLKYTRWPLSQRDTGVLPSILEITFLLPLPIVNFKSTLMKKLLFIACLVIGNGVHAQDFINNTGCDLRFREVCLDPFSCAQLSSSAWVTASGSSTTPLPASGCTGGQLQAFIVENVSPCLAWNTVIVESTGTCATSTTSFGSDCPSCHPITIVISTAGTDVIAN